MSILAHTRQRPAEAPITAIHVTGRRVIATVIDGVVFAAAYVVMALAFGDIKREGGIASWDSGLSPGWNGTYGLLVVAYYVLMEGYLGQTLGKVAAGITVVSEVTGRPPGLAPAALRTLLRLVDGLFSYAVAFVVTLGSDRRQRLGDIVAHTLVVRKAAMSGGR